MSQFIKGNLRGYLCTDCFEAISNVKILLYQTQAQANVTAAAVADTKDTFRLVSAEEAKAKSSLLVATALTDAEGNFTLEVSEKYGNTTAFDIDFYCGTVPKWPFPPRGNDGFQFHLTTIVPQWRTQRGLAATEATSLYYNWGYIIPVKWWCYIRGHFFDAWTICGRILDCATKRPLIGVTVKAMDADFITDDLIGSAPTDSTGHFRIDYTSVDFKKTFLSPWINVETDLAGPFKSGPDVYFIIESGGKVIWEETAADRRNNVGYCLCVDDFCVKLDIPLPQSPESVASAWMSIGTTLGIPAGNNLHEFDANGYALAGKYGLTGVVRLVGQAPNKMSSGNPIEYRFLVSYTDSPNVVPVAAPPTATPAIFTEIVGKTAGLFASEFIGNMVRFTPSFEYVRIYSNAADFDADGWFDVNKAIARTFTALGRVAELSIPSGIGKWESFLSGGSGGCLMALNTAVLAGSPDVPNSAAKAGQPVPLANRMGIEKIAIRFEVREVINKATNLFNYLPGSGHTLNSAVINNNETFKKMAVNQLESLGDCSPIKNKIDLSYTVHHPLLQSASIFIHKNDNSLDKFLFDGFISLSGNTNDAVNHNNNNLVPINATPVNDLTRCTYIVTMSERRRLHSGDSAVPQTQTQLAFFYDGFGI